MRELCRRQRRDDVVEHSREQGAPRQSAGGQEFFQEEQKYERTVEQGLEELVGEYSFRCVEFRG